MRNSALFLILLALSAMMGCRTARHMATDYLEPGYQHLTGNSVSFPASETPAPTADGQEYSIEQCVQTALAQNPELASARHRLDALAHRIPQAQSLPDPMLNTQTHLSPVQTAAGEQRFAFGLNQKMVRSDRRATRAAIADQEMKAAEADLAKMELELAEKVRQTAHQLIALSEVIEITKEDRELLDHLAKVVERQFENKKTVSQQDVLNIHREQSDIENRLTKLAQQKRTLQAKLARLMHVDSSDAITIEGKNESKAASFDLKQLTEKAKQARPDLMAQMARIHRDRNKVNLAMLESKPDLTFGFNWIGTSSSGISPVANGNDAFLIGVGMNLPIYKKRIHAGICEAEANQRASTSKYLSLNDQVAEEIFDLINRAESTLKMLKLLQEDMIPNTERIEKLSTEDYSTGKIDFVQLMANWRALNRYRIAEAELRSQLNQILASLARSVGDLEPVDSPATNPQPDSE